MPHPLENSRLSAELPEEPVCCIVKFRDDLVIGKDIPQMPAVHFQVTVRRDKVSPSGKYIRFGETQGDESLFGWMVRDYLECVEVLGTVDLKTGTVRPIAAA